jgi:hypothetical protein
MRKRAGGMPKHGRMSIVVTDIQGYSGGCPALPSPFPRLFSGRLGGAVAGGGLRGGFRPEVSAAVNAASETVVVTPPGPTPPADGPARDNPSLPRTPPQT